MAKHQAGGRQPEPVPDGLLDLVPMPGRESTVMTYSLRRKNMRIITGSLRRSVQRVPDPYRSTRFARSGSTACPMRTSLPGIVLPVCATVVRDRGGDLPRRCVPSACGPPA